MEAVGWSQSYSVGIKEIDEQHKKLISLLNVLVSATMGPVEEDGIGKILRELVNYTVYHFNTEEKYMEGFNFPGFEEHRKEHEYFKIKVAEFIEKYDKGDAKVTVDLLEFLWSWVKEHIRGMDKKYTGCFLEHGVK
ncbi:MAG: hemerythrin family protein [Candidatus Omnitrophica bacterium]|nr:hemerythrin family protein [Candidatus Omnitrophota bacterium]